MTTIRTARASYEITGLEVKNGKLSIAGCGANGKIRFISKGDVTNARWYAALSQYLSAAQRARRA